VDHPGRHEREVATSNEQSLSGEAILELQSAGEHVHVGVGLPVVVPSAPLARLRLDMPDPAVVTRERLASADARGLLSGELIEL
jgi:hypothetical protein